MAADLIGHDAEIAAFREAELSGRLQHAWLLAGPEGIGKARFADAAALWLLARGASPVPAGERFEVPDGHPSAALFAAGSHPDLKRLRRLPKEKSEELARLINVEQARALGRSFATVPSLSPRRVVVVDAAEQMERNAANALLKNLEEPPAGTIFLLVSHAPGRVLATIRSRCRVLRFAPLSDAETERVLRAALPDELPEAVAALVRVANGAPGSAAHFAGLDIASLEASIERLATRGDPTNSLRTALARSLGTKAAQRRYEAFLERAPRRIAAAAREGGPATRERVELWSRARRIADGAVPQSMDAQTTAFELAGMLASLAPEPAVAKG